jgi:hypothetical protein
VPALRRAVFFVPDANEPVNDSHTLLSPRRLPRRRLDQRGACVLGCLILLTGSLVTVWLLGLIFHRTTVHVIATTGREARVVQAPVAVFHTPGSTARVVERLRPGEHVWVRGFDQSDWVAVFEEQQSRSVLGFAPESSFVAAPSFPSARPGAATRSWGERLRFRLEGGEAPRR